MLKVNNENIKKSPNISIRTLIFFITLRCQTVFCNKSLRPLSLLKAIFNFLWRKDTAKKIILQMIH